MTNYDNTNKGALWAKTSEKGLEYFAGNVNIEGKEFRVSMFTNDKDGNDKRPDFNLKISEFENKEGGEIKQEVKEDPVSQSGLTPEDLPF